MLEHKKYMSIQRIQSNTLDGFNKGDEICIQEKIDGANASFQYDEVFDTVVAFSRNRTLDDTNNLRGFYEWTQQLDVDLVHEVLGEKNRMFCEWLVKHTVPYPKERYQQAYCFDVYNTETKEYLPQEEVEVIVQKLGLNYVPVLYRGEFQSWEHCFTFVGKTELGGDFGEGIVVKNKSKLNNMDSKLPFYIKIVGEDFCEKKSIRKPKHSDSEKMVKLEASKALCATVVTKARVEKILHKMVDEQILSEDWGGTDMPTIAKNLGKRVYEDCLKEENEVVTQVDNFGKVANGIAMRIARDIMASRYHLRSKGGTNGV